jgi:hypothetical protein
MRVGEKSLTVADSRRYAEGDFSTCVEPPHRADGEAWVEKNVSSRTVKLSGREVARLQRRAKLDRLRTDKYASGATDEQVRATLTKIWSQGRQPATVPVRSEFIALTTPLAGDHSDTDGKEIKQAKRAAGPPLCRLVDARGVALRLELLALFVAACARSEPAKLMNLPIAAPADGSPAWPHLVAEPTTHDPGTARATTEKINREQQVRKGFDKLHSIDSPRLGLVDLPRAGVHKGRYAELVLLRESGTTALATAPTYERPKASEPVLHVPVGFWLNGWIHALEDSEIAAWLMFSHHYASASGHETSGMMVTGQTRWARYVQARTVWDKHNQLTAFGLMEVIGADGRRADGTVEDFHPSSPPKRHRMWMRPEGLNNPGVATVLETLAP